jgi:hypothetical protein
VPCNMCDSDEIQRASRKGLLSWGLMGCEGTVISTSAVVDINVLAISSLRHL